jgi:hypothetical protein
MVFAATWTGATATAFAAPALDHVNVAVRNLSAGPRPDRPEPYDVCRRR